jgi:hypothetical protein
MACAELEPGIRAAQRGLGVVSLELDLGQPAVCPTEQHPGTCLLGNPDRASQQELLTGVVNEVKKIKDQIEKIAFPEYLAQHKQRILTSLDQEVRTRESNKHAAEKVLPGIFTSTNVVRLPPRDRRDAPGVQARLGGKEAL